MLDLECCGRVLTPILVFCMKLAGLELGVYLPMYAFQMQVMQEHHHDSIPSCDVRGQHLRQAKTAKIDVFYEPTRGTSASSPLSTTGLSTLECEELDASSTSHVSSIQTPVIFTSGILR